MTRRSLRDVFLGGGAAMTVVLVLERGASFAANLIGARLAGMEAFGAYSLTLSTVGMVAGYAGLDLGATAIRYSGQFPRTSPAYPAFLRALARVVALAAAVGSLAMFAASGVLAERVLDQPDLAWLLRLASLSVAARVVLESVRGICVGQRRYGALVWIAGATGGGLVLAMPLAARIGAPAMVLAEAAVAGGAVLGCLVLAGRFGLTPAPVEAEASTEPPSSRAIARFGAVRFGSVMLVGIGSWLLAASLTRHDPSMGENAFYGVAHQLRGLSAMAPGILATIAFPLLAGPAGQEFGGADRVLRVNAYLVLASSTAIAGAVALPLPWLLPFLYGPDYGAAEGAAALLLASAVAHMSAAPAANRLSIVSLRATTAVNVGWAAVVVASGSALVPFLGATGAAMAWCLGYGFSLLATASGLRWLGERPRGLRTLSWGSLASTLSIGGLGALRAIDPDRFRAPGTIALAAVLLTILGLLWRARDRFVGDAA